MITQVISGGQIGADQAALKAARDLGIPTGGFIPKGWRTVNGRAQWLADYGLKELETAEYPPRTSSNVLMADGTLAIAYDLHTPGELLTRNLCRKFERPYHSVMVPSNLAFDEAVAMEGVIAWVQKYDIHILNVAGNARHDLFDIVYRFVTRLLMELKDAA